jgi:hypothetical protein
MELLGLAVNYQMLGAGLCLMVIIGIAYIAR